MSSPKTHIGRIGALAVALGVGAAVAGGTGVAWADTSTPQDSAASSVSTADVGPAPSRRAARDSAARSVTGAPKRDAGSRRNTAPPAAALTPARNRGDAPDASGGNAVRLTQIAPPGPTAPAVGAVPTAVTAVPATASPTAPEVPVERSVTPLPAAAVSTTPALPPALRQFAVNSHAVSATPSVLVSRLIDRLAALGAGTSPGAPTDSPALWALLAWARRGQTGAAQPAAAAAAVKTSLTSNPLGWVTGQRNTAIPGALWPQTNNTKWANVYGTDLGIMWFNGANGKTQLAFGDTFSGPNMSGDWRSNVLLLSDDTRLTDGLTLINTGPAYQFIPAARNQVFIIGSEVTNIPTSALYANANNYVNYMSVKSWDTPGRWTTNYSAISQYNPATDKWVLQKSTIRSAGWFRASKMYQAGDQNFQMMAYVLQPADQVTTGNRYVYAFGTPAGRAGSAFLSRVPEGNITDLRKYEYWDGSKWVGNQAKAAPVIGDSTKSRGLLGPFIDLANNPKFFGGWLAGFTGAKTGGNVSEMSVQYNDYLGKYVVLYGNGANNVILRTADTPEGPWSDPVTIATSIQYPGLYAPMIHPLSGTGQLTDSSGDPDVSHLYWNMSIWGNYNVVLMQTDLAPLKTTPV